MLNHRRRVHSHVAPHNLKVMEFRFKRISEIMRGKPSRCTQRKRISEMEAFSIIHMCEIGAGKVNATTQKL